MCVVVVVVDVDEELGVTVKYIKILNIAQQYFYGKIISPATIQTISKLFERNCVSPYSNSFYTLHKEPALKQTYVRLLVALLRPKI